MVASTFIKNAKVRTKKPQYRKSESILRQMKHHRACRLVNAEIAAIVQVE